MREVAKRQVAGVDHVDVEVDDHRPAPGQGGQRRPGRRLRIGDQSGPVGIADPPGRQEPAAILGHLSRVAADNGQAGGVKQRRLARQPDEFGLAVAEQVRDAGRVEDPRALRRQRAEVGVAVHVSQSGAGMHPAETGDDAERDRAVAAQHERSQARLYEAGDCVGNLARNLHDGVQVACARMLVVHGKH